MSVWLGDPEKKGEKKKRRQVYTVCLYFYPRGQGLVFVPSASCS